MAKTARILQFTHGTTNTISNWNVNGSAGVLMTVQSDTAALATLAFTKDASCDYIQPIWMKATESSVYAGTHSVDGGNNVDWIFTAPLPARQITSPSGLTSSHNLLNLKNI